MTARSTTPGLATTLAAVLLAFALTGCATAPAPGPVPGSAPAVAIDHFEERALLLLLADRRTYDPITISRALDGPPDLRRQVAYTVARIGDPRGIQLLESLLGDPAPGVRRTAAFGLGLVAGPGSASQNLLGAVNDPDRETGILAVEALARHGVALEDVVARLIEGPSDELFPRLLPPLFLFRGPAVVRWAEQGLESDDPRLRALAAYALARNPQPEGAELLRGLLDDSDPWIRGWAARALGNVGGRGDLDRLRPLLDDPEPGPIVRALNASRSLIAAGHEAAPPAWIPRLVELLTDSRPGVRTTALEVSSVWLLDETLGQALAAFAESPVRRERELALLALAEGGDPRGAALVVRWADDPDPVMRSRVAEAAALYGSESLLEDLADDPVAGVRQATLDVRLAARTTEEAEPLVLRAFDDPDPAVRSTAIGWAERNPVVGVDLLAAVTAASRRDRLPDARLAAVGAFEARANAESLERGAAVAELEILAGDPEPAVQQAAARALRGLDRDPPTPGPTTRKPIDVYRQVIERTASPPRFELFTEKGSFTVALECTEAPLTCLNFIQLAGQGFYDGTAWHRVVPDFVVQGGDPRGDGFGGPGYTLRHEANLLRYERGVLGMAHSGPETAGSQFFVTLSSQPHLDGGYVAFGRVVAGDSVLDTLVQGDTILRVVEVPRP